jgi:NitT/TauT family transport system ATP-binding protein
MRQRVAIARALVQEPDVMLMDEPFAALDEQTRTRMAYELLQIWERSRRTIVFITHGLTEAIYLADVILVMAARPGRIIERIEVPLARPRNIDMIGSETFGQLRNRIWHLIGDSGGDSSIG